MSTHSVIIGGITLHYFDAGAGDPVLLLHGGSGNHRSWQVLVPDLTRDYRLIIPDLRGHGASQHTAGAYQLQMFAADGIALLECLKLPPVHLVGHSFGAQVAAIIAANAPTLVRSVALLDTPLSLEQLRTHIEANRKMTGRWRELAALGLSAPELTPLLHAMLLPVGDESRPAIELLGEAHPWFVYMADCLAHHDPAFLDAVLDDFERTHRAFEVASLFPHTPVPTLLLQAEPAVGGLMSDEEAAWGLSLLPNGQLTRLTGVSHTMQNESPAAVLEALKKFWKGI